MSFTADDFEKFVKEQAKINIENNKKLIQDALDWHKENCSTAREDCENIFMAFFFLAMESELNGEVMKSMPFPPHFYGNPN